VEPGVNLGVENWQMATLKRPKSASGDKKSSGINAIVYQVTASTTNSNDKGNLESRSHP